MKTSGGLKKAGFIGVHSVVSVKPHGPGAMVIGEAAGDVPGGGHNGVGNRTFVDVFVAAGGVFMLVAGTVGVEIS